MSRPVRRDRAVARLAAVQALYQMEAAGAGVEAVIREFLDHRFEADIEGRPLAPGDETFFAELTRGVVAEQAVIDAAIRARLASGWRMSRLDATARAILRCGAYELMHRPEIPTEVVIDEYLEIAKSFFDGPEPAFINGLLDGLAHDQRAA